MLSCWCILYFRAMVFVRNSIYSQLCIKFPTMKKILPTGKHAQIYIYKRIKSAEWILTISADSNSTWHVEHPMPSPIGTDFPSELVTLSILTAVTKQKSFVECLLERIHCCHHGYSLLCIPQLCIQLRTAVMSNIRKLHLHFFWHSLLFISMFKQTVSKCAHQP